MKRKGPSTLKESLRVVCSLLSVLLMLSLNGSPFLTAESPGFSDPAALDSDGDTVYDFEERARGTSPYLRDTDGDGLNDSYELGILPLGRYSLMKKMATPLVITYWDPGKPADWGDPAPAWAGEGLGTFLGHPAGPPEGAPFYDSLDEWNGDSDGDGLSDGQEVSMRIATGKPVSIMERVDDYTKGDWLLYDPTSADSDRDGVPDPVEFRLKLHNYDRKVQGAYADYDGDGLSDFKEIFVFRTDPSRTDTDLDGMSDAREAAYGTIATNGDMDGDGILDGDESWILEMNGVDEYRNQTLRFSHAIPEYPWSRNVTYTHSPYRNFLDDHDGDGLNDKEEMAAGLGDPDLKDSDDDGMDDKEEQLFGSNPFHRDTDMDWLHDRTELAFGTDPIVNDTDGDGLLDGEEVFGDEPTDPNSEDTDGDGLNDTAEVRLYYTSPLRQDTDGDNLNDRREVNETHSNPSSADTDSDGLNDAEENNEGTNPEEKDTDRDGLSDWDEVQLGTDPVKGDPDKDGLTDKEETFYGTKPYLADQDGDSVNDSVERGRQTNPFNPDTDGDGFPDGTDQNPTYNCVTNTTVFYPWDGQTPLTLSVTGEYSMSADGNTIINFTVYVYGPGAAGVTVYVRQDRPLGVFDPSSGSTNASGIWQFTYRPKLLVGSDATVLLTISTGSGAEVIRPLRLDARDVRVQVLDSPVYGELGFTSKFRVKVADTSGDPLDSVSLTVNTFKLPGAVSLRKVNGTHYEGTWAPSKRGTFPLEVMADYKGTKSYHIVTAVAGPSPLDFQMAFVNRFVTQLAQRHPDEAHRILDKLDVLRESYYKGTDDDRRNVINQTIVIRNLLYSHLEIEKEIARVAAAAVEFVLSLGVLDSAFGWFYGKLSDKVMKTATVQRLVARARTLMGELGGMIIMKLDASGFSEGRLWTLWNLTQALNSNLTELIKNAVPALPGLSAIKTVVENEVKAQKAMAVEAMVVGLTRPLAKTLAGDVERAALKPDLKVVSWVDPIKLRIQKLRQYATQFVTVDGWGETISATVSGFLSDGPEWIYWGIKMAEISTGGLIAALFEVLTRLVKALSIGASCLRGVNFAATFTRLISLGTASIAGGRATPTVSLPSPLDPSNDVRGFSLAFSQVGAAAWPGNMSLFFGRLEGFISAGEKSSASLALASAYINGREVDGTADANGSEEALEGYRNLMSAELEAVHAALAASLVWENLSVRAGVRAASAGLNRTVAAYGRNAGNVTVTTGPAPAFLPELLATEGPSGSLAVGAQFSVDARVGNSGTVAGNATVLFEYAGTRMEQNLSLEALSETTARFGPLAAAEGARLMTVWLDGTPGSITAVVDGFSIARDPSLAARYPADGENLSASPDEIFVLVADGTGDRSVRAGRFELDGAVAGNFTGAGAQSVRLDGRGVGNGTHNVSVMLNTAARDFAFNWTFMVGAPVPPANATGGVLNGTGNGTGGGTGGTGGGARSPGSGGVPSYALYGMLIALAVAVSVAAVMRLRRRS